MLAMHAWLCCDADRDDRGVHHAQTFWDQCMSDVCQFGGVRNVVWAVLSLPAWRAAFHVHGGPCFVVICLSLQLTSFVLVQVNELYTAHVEFLSERSYFDNSIDSIQANIQWLQLNAEQVCMWLQSA